MMEDRQSSRKKQDSGQAQSSRKEHNISMESFEKLRDYYSSQKGR